MIKSNDWIVDGEWQCFCEISESSARVGTLVGNISVKILELVTF